MRVNIENCVRLSGADRGHKWVLTEMIGHLKELRDDPTKHGEFFSLYQFSDRKFQDVRPL